MMRKNVRTPCDPAPKICPVYGLINVISFGAVVILAGIEGSEESERLAGLIPGLVLQKLSMRATAESAAVSAGACTLHAVLSAQAVICF
jgi:hypothetical protein